MTDFQQMNLPKPIEQALRAMQFHQPTPIQSQTIPLALEYKDIIGCAQTGTGKTAAFGIPVVKRLLENPGKSALILAPTRELAKQIADVLRSLTSAGANLKLVLLVGGADMRMQGKALAKRPQIVVATPGRLADHLRRRNLSLQQLEILVLDEGDRMLDMGFAPQLDEILKFLPKTRQTLLFSATLPPRVQTLANKYLNNPVRVTVGQESRPVEAVNQKVIHTTSKEKNDVLLDELNAREGSVIIFARTKQRTDRVARYLTEYGFSVAKIHGGRTQGQRNSAIKGFRAGEYRILVATDIASRGLDIPHIAHVINYDLPMFHEDYVHRIGRTARAGAKGEALSLLLPEDKSNWARISRKYNPENAPAQERGRGHQRPRQAGPFQREDRDNARTARKERSERIEVRHPRGNEARPQRSQKKAQWQKRDEEKQHGRGQRKEQQRRRGHKQQQGPKSQTQGREENHPFAHNIRKNKSGKKKGRFFKRPS